MSKVCFPTKISFLRSGFRGHFFFPERDLLLFVLLNASLIVKVTELNEKNQK